MSTKQANMKDRVWGKCVEEVGEGEGGEEGTWSKQYSASCQNNSSVIGNQCEHGSWGEIQWCPPALRGKIRRIKRGWNPWRVRSVRLHVCVKNAKWIDWRNQTQMSRKRLHFNYPIATLYLCGRCTLRISHRTDGKILLIWWKVFGCISI